MKARIEPTHFIEQYNKSERFKYPNGRNEDHTPVHNISYLKDALKFTEQMSTMKTVALWKIKYKNNSIT